MKRDAEMASAVGNDFVTGNVINMSSVSCKSRTQMSAGGGALQGNRARAVGDLSCRLECACELGGCERVGQVCSVCSSLHTSGKLKPRPKGDG